MRNPQETSNLFRGSFRSAQAPRVALQAETTIRLRLIGLAVAACRLVVASGNGRLRRFHFRLGGFNLRLSSFMQFVAEFVLCFLKLLYRLPHSAGKFRQLLRSEQDQDNQQDDDQVRPCQIHETGNKAHALGFNIRPFPEVSRQIPLGWNRGSEVDMLKLLWKKGFLSMRPTWKGSISFGLVYIPVAVYPATREEKISFRQLRSSDLSPIRYKKVAEADSKEVPADQIVKGFEYERGHYVVMKDEDFEKVRIESTHSIDITDFVDLEQVDPKFFYKPYFLEPQKGGEKAYAVLHKALAGTGKIGIAKVVISNREHLAAVKPDGLFLILELMHFASEILSTEVLKNGSATAVSDKELKMAQALIDSMAVSWEPEKYRDEYRTALMEIIEQKAQNREIAAKAPTPPSPTNVVDLVKVLQDSLNRTQSLKQKRASASSSARRSTSALVKQRRRTSAVG